MNVRTSMTVAPRKPVTLAVIGYAILFAIVLPGAFLAWALGLDRFVELPLIDAPVAGALLVGGGLSLVFSAYWALWYHGRGFPMSVFPPEHFVMKGPYRYLHDPIYTGAIVAFVGSAILLRSPASFWIVAPVLTLTCVAWLLGFERDYTHALFGPHMQPPRIRFPADTLESPDAWDRVSFYLLVLLPWGILYQMVEQLGVPSDAINGITALDRQIPLVVWTVSIYFLSYPVVLASPWVAPSRHELRWLMTRGWIATLMIIPLYLLIPVAVQPKPVTGSDFFSQLLQGQQTFDRAITAFPAFHVVWTFLALRMFVRRWPGQKIAWWILGALIALSCLTTSMHALPDVIAGLLAWWLVIRIDRVWSLVRHVAERIANSWHEVRLGPVRMMNHGLYAAAGAWVGTLVAVALAGPENLWPVVLTAACSILGAALWAQIIEGSSQLLRPYGYFGSIVGGVLTLLVLAIFGADFWRLFAALLTGACFTQAIGRIRCLVQGCCHGAACPEWLGLRYMHPRSRVTRLSTLGGKPVHPTPLYSAFWMIFVGAVLLRLWWVGAGLQLIAGFYFILVGLGRFVEEHYRGEPQTVIVGGLRLYQWFAIAFVIIGAAMSTLGNTVPAPASVPSLGSVLLITGFSLLAYFAYGVDFPELNTRFSRLV